MAARKIFFVDAASFIIAVVIILSLPPLVVAREAKGDVVHLKIRMDI
jgi:hypothetical protein